MGSRPPGLLAKAPAPQWVKTKCNSCRETRPCRACRYGLCKDSRARGYSNSLSKGRVYDMVLFGNTKQAASAKTSLTYLTVGALTIVWTVIWYIYLNNNGAQPN